MSNRKKKRNKRYRGADAKQSTPNIIRVSAVKRSKTGQWWHEKKRSIMTSAGIVAVVIVVLIIIAELVKLFIN
ncbi:hypothetical protein GX865_03305 [Candidatus Saccharibacteria bacterium]|nr:hypothetical protein [Candidatus Saccharibacteria bacterium]